MRRFNTREAAMRKFLTETVGVEVRVPRAYHEVYRGYSDTLELDRLIHSMPREQLDILVCLTLGMEPQEIVVALKYPNVVRYYNESAKLRKLYLERKGQYLDYT